MSFALASQNALQELPFSVEGDPSFNAAALYLFRLHAADNPVYRGFLEALGVRPVDVHRVDDIPHLPIGFFRNHRVLLNGCSPELVFTSSGTTGAVTATHHVALPALYERSFLSSFTRVHGDPSRWRILALLPAYLERPGSSLVYMVERLITATGDPHSGTYLYDHEELMRVLLRSERDARPTLLLGVPFALLDLAERFPMHLEHTVIMETGGMKGRRPEMVREDLHARLCSAFQVEHIHSEYGMTELLSQAWSTGNGRYHCPPWMRMRVRDVNDPRAHVPPGRTGGIDVIDLCNLASCPFISTQDLGRAFPDGSFEVLGRFDHSDTRGCNLMV